LSIKKVQYRFGEASPVPSKERTHRIVDAMNVIGSRPDGWWRDRGGAVERLVGQLDAWAESSGERVTVVLEKQPSRLIEARRVEVVWARRPGRDAADDEIVRRLPEWVTDGEVVVVTSDRELVERARAAGAAVEPASGFRRQLDGVPSQKS
jgi:predicted RNA-binding protein with PIN domain